MITFSDVTKSYPVGTKALDGVSFEIQDNEFVYLVGQSGAGKTTILKLLLRSILPTSGSIIVNGQEIGIKTFNAVSRLRRSIGVVFQDFKLLPDKNVFENIALSLRVIGTPHALIKDQVMEGLRMVKLEKKEWLFPIQLSAGEVQRVAIARAIMGKRKIILADEPTGNLDPKTTWEIMRIFRDLEKTHTILFATHNADIVNSMKRRVIALKHGAIVQDARKGGYTV